MSKLFKKSVALFATAAILATTSVTAFAEAKAPAGNTDTIVWVGAKDVKAKKGTDEFDTLMKTEVFTHVGNYSGGKIGVAVLKKGTDATTVADFVKLFDDKGKFSAEKAKEGKNYASAKYKEGQITVSAGKTPGDVEIWVYETKKVDGKMKVMNESVPSGTGADPTGVKVEPKKYDFTVKASVTSPQFVLDPKGVTAPTGKGTLAGTIAKGDKTVELAIKASAEKKTIYIADKSVEAAADAKGNTWTILTTDKAKYDDAVITLATDAKVAYDSESKAFKLDITAKGEGKTTLNIQNDQSGKILKVNVVVTKWVKVTGPSAVKMAVNGGTAAEMSSDGTYVAPKSKVTFDKTVKVDGKEYAAGKAVTITKETKVEEVKAES